MSLDLSRFRKSFFEESFEGLEIMEAGLLHLDAGQADPESINDVFRAAHSIKGGSGMFGLDVVTSFTHVMETLLDQMRDGSRKVTKDVVNVLLGSVDRLRDLLVAGRDGGELDPGDVVEQQNKLEALLGQTGTAAADTDSNDDQIAVAQKNSIVHAAWTISFYPQVDMFRSGNDPLRIIRELGCLGKLQVEVDLSQLPKLSQLDPEQCYLGWSIRLDGKVDRAAIEEVFVWVSGDCKLDISPIEAEKAVQTAGPIAGSVVGANGELVGDRRVGDRRAGDRRKSGGTAKETTSIRVDTDKVDEIINQVGELVITQAMLSALGEDFAMEKIQSLRSGLGQLERNSRNLQESVMRMRMLPISYAFNRLPRMVHDLSAKLGKKVRLDINGETTELDKTVIEKIGDPLVHLVRNSLDHGLEMPQERVAAGKSETGVIMLNAYHQGGSIIVEVGDDGRGIDEAKILAKAIEKGMVAADAKPSREQIHEFLFAPGLSTVEEVSDVSGRGVGMDVVRRNIQSLGGTVEVYSEKGRGTTFKVRLPLTLAIVDGQSIAVGEEYYIIPLISIVESLQGRGQNFNKVAGKGELIKFRDQYVPIIRLYEVFDAQTRIRQLEDGLIVIVEGEGRMAAFLVDELLGQQQVVIKSLEQNFRRIDGVSGATILGDGSVALILDVPGLIRLAYQR